MLYEQAMFSYRVSGAAILDMDMALAIEKLPAGPLSVVLGRVGIDHLRRGEGGGGERQG